MITREQYELITNTGGGGSGATQTEIYEIFEGINSQGKANSLFETLSGSNKALANLLIESKSGTFDTAANLLYFLTQFLAPNGNNGETIANQLSETISGGDQTLANLLVDTQTGSNLSAANLLFEISNALNSQRTPEIINTATSGTINQQIHNISIANIGSSTGTITVNGTTSNLLPGISIEFNAGGLNNRFAVNSFSYNATGTNFLINYVR